MNNSTQRLYTQFDQGINWNAFLYVTQKLLTTLLSFILFYKLTPINFSIWANINSIVFLILLWMDFGFRKSIPCYIPEISKNPKSHISFTKFIILCQALGLIIVSFIFCIYTYYFPLQISGSLLFLAIIIFFLEAPIALLKLIYHAHFWNKEFNVLYSTVILFETLAVILYLNLNYNLLIGIMIIKILSGITINILAILGLKKLYINKVYLNNDIYNYKKIKTDFIKHSGVMWGSTILKSLTERNFIFPLLTVTLGLEPANIFKVANDWALLFQRSIVKTIGTTDTLLFAQVNELKNENIMNEAFQKISSKIRGLSIPLFGILILLFFLKNYFVQDQLIFKAFILLVISYLIESLLSPYERVLEVKKRYLILIFAYVPFIMFLFITLNKRILSYFGLIEFIFLLCFVRLVSSAIITWHTRRTYNLKFLSISIVSLFKSLIFKK